MQVNLCDSNLSSTINAIRTKKKATRTLINFSPLHDKGYSLLLLSGYQLTNIIASYFMQIDSCTFIYQKCSYKISTMEESWLRLFLNSFEHSKRDAMWSFRTIYSWINRHTFFKRIWQHFYSWYTFAGKMDVRCSRDNREATKKEAFAVENSITKTTRSVLSYDASRGTVSKTGICHGDLTFHWRSRKKEKQKIWWKRNLLMETMSIEHKPVPMEMTRLFLRRS